MRSPFIAGPVAALLLCSITPVWSQSPPIPERPAQIDPKGCAPGERMQSADPATGGKSAPSTTGENLSDKLARTDGVLCPPNVGPDMRVPAPGGGKMPVIPPPGSPGGDPSVQPK
jgi:hypothetical protein